MLKVDERTVQTLIDLCDEINYEESHDDECNTDLVLDNLYKIFHIVDNLTLNREDY